MTGNGNFWWRDFRRRWRPESVICVQYFIPAVLCSCLGLALFSASPVLSHIAAIVLSSIFVSAQYYLLPFPLFEVSHVIVYRWSVLDCLIGSLLWPDRKIVWTFRSIGWLACLTSWVFPLQQIDWLVDWLTRIQKIFLLSVHWVFWCSFSY